MHLYRVITMENWQKAQSQGYVPRCGNDHNADCVHLNVHKAVVFSANRYFTPEEAPVVIEVDITSFKDKIEWLKPTEDQPWQKPRAHIDHIPLSAVISMHALEYRGEAFVW
ncbi:DUF952 domain-containing protein [Halomonas dongshanensis]|uniref:DUF952 domain-containing protein n=1 Tax=Halomonas dongshanensis TaxID=2890835 RepID=A0ABT2ECV2_9GAMM|nr:DUF952 domain-containing protein [Halomonas dongshanensis]MCS2608482.1 DUF952 domain-containing protein [Halomonas dongshanensis]